MTSPSPSRISQCRRKKNKCKYRSISAVGRKYKEKSICAELFVLCAGVRKLKPEPSSDLELSFPLASARENRLNKQKTLLLKKNEEKSLWFFDESRCTDCGNDIGEMELAFREKEKQCEMCQVRPWTTLGSSGRHNGPGNIHPNYVDDNRLYSKEYTDCCSSTVTCSHWQDHVAHYVLNNWVKNVNDCGN